MQYSISYFLKVDKFILTAFSPKINLLDVELTKRLFALTRMYFEMGFPVLYGTDSVWEKNVASAKRNPRDWNIH